MPQKNIVHTVGAVLWYTCMFLIALTIAVATGAPAQTGMFDPQADIYPDTVSVTAPLPGTTGLAEGLDSGLLGSTTGPAVYNLGAGVSELGYWIAGT